MGICDFSSVIQTIKEYISDSRELSQTDLLYEVFATFINDEENSGYAQAVPYIHRDTLLL